MCVRERRGNKKLYIYIYDASGREKIEWVFIVFLLTVAAACFQIHCPSMVN